MKLPEMHRKLNQADERLYVEAQTLIDYLNPAIPEQLAQEYYGRERDAGLTQTAIDLAGGTAAKAGSSMVPNLTPALLAFRGAQKAGKWVRETYAEIPRYKNYVVGHTFSRATVSLSHRDQGVLLALAHACDAGQLAEDKYDRFVHLLTWNGGECDVQPHWQGTPEVAAATQAICKRLAENLPKPDTVASDAINAIANAPQSLTQPNLMSDSYLHRGAHWMTPNELLTSSVLSINPEPASLILGSYDDGRHRHTVYYNRNRALFTIAAPDSGKSRALAMTNLVNYAGSVFVVDVKGELWNETAGYRAAGLKAPCYRFAPFEPGNTHYYNPLDAIPQPKSTNDHLTAELAAQECAAMAEILLPESRANDPYWEQRGKAYLAAFLTCIALAAKPQHRNLESALNLMAIPLEKETMANPNDPKRQIKVTPQVTQDVIDHLTNIGKKYNVESLGRRAVEIKNGIGSTRLPAILDQAALALQTFELSPSLRQITSRSSWTPENLAKRTGTSIYICVPADRINVVASLIRLMFVQHFRALTNPATFNKPHYPPVTFFIDEFPQLGKVETIQQMVELGRGAGVRPWMFAQTIDQIRAKERYDTEADGLINMCGIRSFMAPTNKESEFIEASLGERIHIVNGEKLPLATRNELEGRMYAEKLILNPHRDEPVLLDKIWANDAFGHRMKLPTPKIIP